MAHHLLNEIEQGNKSALQKKKIITYYIYHGGSTIVDLSKELNLSVPTVAKLINEMCDEGYIRDYGKLETAGGRHPILYGLNPGSGAAAFRVRHRISTGISQTLAGNCGAAR